MEFRLATLLDLPELKAVYQELIQHMNQNQMEGC